MKQHLAVLDGFRGVAALSVVIFHLAELTDDPSKIIFGHAYLAVDLFFCLSGYVLGYAYDDRQGRMRIRDFLTARAIRLHPLVVIGLLLGLASYVLDPFAKAQVAPAWMIAASTIGGLLLIPTWPLPERWNTYLSLNSPSWTLMFEYLASIAFALLLWRMDRRVLAGVTAIAAGALIFAASRNGNLSTGWAWDTIHYGFARMAFSFCMGLLLFRWRVALRTPLGFVALSAAMVVLFMIPFDPKNWVYDAAVVVLGFPLIIALGAGARVSGGVERLCGVLGRLSYPLYILHYPFIHVYGNYHWTRGISPAALPYVMAGMTLFLVGFSWAMLVFYDEPLRRWLSARRRRKPVPAIAAA